MLGLGLMLFCLRALDPRQAWNERLVRFSFGSINVGLMGMVVLSLLPVGLLADVGAGGARLLVCARRGVGDEHAALAARAR